MLEPVVGNNFGCTYSFGVLQTRPSKRQALLHLALCDCSNELGMSGLQSFHADLMCRILAQMIACHALRAMLNSHRAKYNTAGTVCALVEDAETASDCVTCGSVTVSGLLLHKLLT